MTDIYPTDKYLEKYFQGASTLLDQLDYQAISQSIKYLAKLKKIRGRLFLIGVGGSAANCSHAVNDFRKICNIESYTPADNISELTARTNDDGWQTIFANWLKVSRLNNNDILMVLSVGGGNLKKNISVNIVKALKYARKKKTKVIGIVSRNGGYTKKAANVVIMIPVLVEKLTTAYAESFQSVILHAIVNSPVLCKK
ncbi:SIS domain-containing protein [Candidatus Microgenomates bacterium]|nr:SIS domain-containing protein [Candidatus Microgenomates bacterium]